MPHWRPIFHSAAAANEGAYGIKVASSKDLER